MCLILFGDITDIRKLELERAWRSNDDGAGFIILGKPAKIVRGIMKIKQFNREIKRIPDGSQVAVHFRQATHGAPSKRWCHPFPAGHDCWLMHNGVLHELGQRGNNGESDSAHLATILSFMPLEQKIPLLSQIVGYSNRILLVQNDTFATFGKWETHANVKMSNSLLIPAAPHSYTGFTNPAMGFHANFANSYTPSKPDVYTSSKRGKSYFRNGAWTPEEDIIEESKHEIGIPANTDHQSAALPFRKADITDCDIPSRPEANSIDHLFEEDTPEDKSFEEYLRQRRSIYDGD